MTKQTLIIALAQLLATSLWFSANVAAGAVSADYLGAMTTAVQGGFIFGTLLFSFGGLADRFRPSRVFAVSAVLGAAFNLAFVLSDLSPGLQLAWRFLVGWALAGVYPIGMKLAVAWAPGRAGQTLGLLVGMLTLGTALPLGVRSLGAVSAWQSAVLVSSVLAVIAAGMVVSVGDAATAPGTAKVKAGGFFQAFKIPRFRDTAFGYFGHMWELYAFWTLVPLLVGGAVAGSNLEQPGYVWAISFAVIAVGAIGCIRGGNLTRDIGSERVAGAALAISGLMCLAYPLLSAAHYSVKLAALFIWGAAVIADSPQFSALAARHCPPTLVGSSLALQTSIGFAITIISILAATAAYPAIGDKVAWLLLPGPALGLFALRRMIFVPFEEILPPLAPSAAALAESREARAAWYMRKAADARAQANKAEDGQARDGWLRVAQDWERLAEGARREDLA